MKDVEAIIKAVTNLGEKAEAQAEKKAGKDGINWREQVVELIAKFDRASEGIEDASDEELLRSVERLVSGGDKEDGPSKGDMEDAEDEDDMWEKREAMKKRKPKPEPREPRGFSKSAERFMGKPKGDEGPDRDEEEDE